MTETKLSINITGAKENNLKNISLAIPHYKLVTITGVSGSGKSSLAFDTIASEGRRQYLESIPSFARQFAGKISKPEVEEIEGLFPVITISQKTTGNSLKSTVGTLSEIYDHLRLLFARFGKTESNIKLTRSLFSFNSPIGACPKCSGIGLEEKISLNKLVADPDKTLRQGALVPTLPNGYIMYSQVTVDVLNTVCEEHGFNVDIPWKDLTDDQKNVILYGSNKIKVLYGKHSLESRLKWTALKAKPREEGYYKGMLPIMEDILKRDRNTNILRFVESVRCSSCEGKRLNAVALSVTYHGKTIDFLSDIELSELLSFLKNITPGDLAEGKILNKMISNLELLCSLGVSHLKLSRPASTLSGGETQRLKLVNQLSAQLSNVLYVFDEPSIGLHPRDNQSMLRILRELVNNGNTVIIIEHDLETIRQSDWIIEIGPDAGINGGELLYNGPADEFLTFISTNGLTPTQKALQAPSINYKGKKNGTDFQVRNCRNNNLKGFDVTFKKNSLNVVTGVSGAGKASLVYGCLTPLLKNVIHVDQSPIGRTPRSNPATYTGLADNIRDLFAKQITALQLGFKKGRFSFNTYGGRCETCLGAGKLQIGMHYMGSIDIICDACNGKRFNDETLQVKYKGKSISDVYNLSIKEASDIFEKEPKVNKYLKTLQSLGLGYLQLGQSSTTLSGGEAQRIKLAASLVKIAKNDTWFILDEPTTGLHYQDTELLINALRELTLQGNTVVCIENQEQFIAAADWIIDIGPESGVSGGNLVFQGYWNDFKNNEYSVTAKSLNSRYPAELTSPRLTDSIKIFGAATNNLKGIEAEFPKNKITVLTGVSGSGKSSLAFHTLFAESQSRFTESLSTYARSFIKQSNFAKADSFENLTPAIAINRKNLPVSPRSTVGTMTGINEKYRFLYSRIAQSKKLNYSAKDFSFNHETGACKACSGLGELLSADSHKLAPDWNKSIIEGALTHNATIKYYGNPDGQFVAVLKEAANHLNIDLNKSLKDFNNDELKVIFHGTGNRIWDTVWNFRTRTSSGSKSVSSTWKGFCTLIDEEHKRRLHNKDLSLIESMMHEVECSECHGSRLNHEVLTVKIKEKNIHELSSLSIKDTINWFEELIASGEHSQIIKELYGFIQPRQVTMLDLGLGHLSMTRRSSTLSGGEGQRLRLAQQLSGGLTGMTYILDEPTIGLHQKNVNELLSIIQKLKDKGNTIVIVEHDKEVIKFADNIIEIGPLSGNEGGQIVAQGNLNEFLLSEKAITPKYLVDDKLPTPKTRSIINNAFGLAGVTKHNLINRNFDFSSEGIIAITGVSGAGKSTLVQHVLAPTLLNREPVNCKSFYTNVRFDQIISVDHTMITGSESSTVASYTGILDILQTLFASAQADKEIGLSRGSFSYLNKDGKCLNCNGMGRIKISMDFMDDVWNACDECDGNRYNDKVLSVLVSNKSIAEVLNLSVLEASNFMETIESKTTDKAHDILAHLIDIGLGHLKLWQTTSSLSGGESQRLKLTVNLLRSKGDKVLFLLDEPSSGLHYKDLDDLIRVFDKLIDDGHTVLFIEHNPYLISIADEVIGL